MNNVIEESEHVFLAYKGIDPYKFVNCRYCNVTYMQYELDLSKTEKFNIEKNCISNDEKIIKDIIE